LAITPDGNKLYAAMQSPLIQDGGRKGVNVRFLKLDLPTGATRELLYQMESKEFGVNEILAVNDHEFLVIERDGKSGAKSKSKKIFKIDITGATDVSSVAALPVMGTPQGVVSVKKSLFLNMQDKQFGLDLATLPEKIEGLAFGPDLSDGRRLLLVTTDNDFISTQPTWIYAFAIDRGDLPGLQHQVFDQNR
jgi:hypothetical protein